MLAGLASSTILLGFTASLLAGLASGLGALPIFAVRRLSDQVQEVMLGFAAGVMLAASFFSLILPGLAAAQARGSSELGAVSIVGCGILLGAAGLWLVHRYAPHEHFVSGREGPSSERIRRIWLFVVAITLHNFPEGLAVGVGFGGGEVGNGVALAIGIGLQNIPEGLAVAVALLTLNYSRLQALWVATLTGLVEPVGGLVGAAAVTVAQPILPWGLAFAAGAMIFVISNEIIPEMHRRSGLKNFATEGLMVGLVVMMFLDVLLG
ncbi:ZIP family metal transporter [Reyranella sp.]|uniref:ZIP family metal transporter n=1 Tax=Reyranella sp. TaxID=1929291 RepID=UPI003BAA4667